VAEVFTMVKNICLAVVLMTMAGVAFADEDGEHSNKCFHILWFDVCPPSDKHVPPVTAPEIDPSSAVAGLTLMMGGLAVLRGRRSKITKQ
jgi:hypothetical protein